MVVHSEKEAHVVRLTQQLELLVAHPERVGQIVRTPASALHLNPLPLPYKSLSKSKLKDNLVLILHWYRWTSFSPARICISSAPINAVSIKLKCNMQLLRYEWCTAPWLSVWSLSAFYFNEDMQSCSLLKSAMLSHSLLFRFAMYLLNIHECAVIHGEEYFVAGL